MKIKIPYHTAQIEVEVPDQTTVYQTSYPEPKMTAAELVLNAVQNPVGSPPLAEAIKASNAKTVVVVVSDITRPIPYVDFLLNMLEEIESVGIKRENIVVLIATGMHRASTREEHLHMFGKTVCGQYRVIDHDAENENDLASVDGTSYAGRPIKLNKYYVDADFKIITGLVEPHFMAGFSGGRKSVCPGLCALETIEAFHSSNFLNNPNAKNLNLTGNPLHNEALSIAKIARVDFCLNVIVNKEHNLVDAVAGSLETSHEKTIEFVKKNTCPVVTKEVDVVITSSGGYPLDATFYQCVKGMNSCLAAVKENGTIVAIGGCVEKIGGSEYKETMFKYSGKWPEFLRDIKDQDRPVKDQWQFQMQTRVLKHVGDDNLLFVTNGIPKDDLSKLSVTATTPENMTVEEKVQELIDGYVKQGKSLAVIPEGPYCAPTK